MPTRDVLASFLDDYTRLTRDQQNRFKGALTRFIDGCTSSTFQPGLRVKRVQGTPNIYEMTWAPDGRATFQYGESLQEGEVHIIWRRIGTHSILDRP